MNNRAVIDVSRLPASAMDHRSPIWWGNILLLLIETTMFALLIATYLYFRIVDFDRWPPPRVPGGPSRPGPAERPGSPRATPPVPSGAWT